MRADRYVVGYEFDDGTFVMFRNIFYLKEAKEMIKDTDKRKIYRLVEVKQRKKK